MKNKLTKPQQDLLNRFNNGEKIRKVNDEYRFDDNSLCRYRVFWNLMSAIKGKPSDYFKKDYDGLEFIDKSPIPYETLGEKFKEEALNFQPFQVVAKRDDGTFENVYLLKIKFIDGELGLCIWRKSDGIFIEEPDTLEGYSTTEEKLFNKYGI